MVFCPSGPKRYTRDSDQFTYTYRNAGYYKVVVFADNQGWTCSQSATIHVISPNGGSGTNTFTVTSGASSSGANMTVILYQDIANPTTVPNSLVGDGHLATNSGSVTLTSLTAAKPGPNYQVYLYYATGESCTPTGLTADANCPSGLTNSGASTVGACGSAAPSTAISVVCTP